jgi:enamine deaminase RidA (YjgF/YER057c/UK114 family)
MAAELVFTGQIAPDPLVGEHVAAQARSVLSRLAATLAKRGLLLEDLLRLRLFVRDLDELPSIEAAMDRDGTTAWPAVSVVELTGNSAEPGVTITLDAVATPGTGEQRRAMRPSDPGDRGPGVGLGGAPRTVRLGPWVFVGATTALTNRTPSPSPTGDPAAEDSAMRRIGEESRVVFARIDEQLRRQGAELRDVVKVGGWLTFPVRQSDYRPLGEVREALLTEAGLFPASAAVRVGRVQPAGALLAFEAIAYAPEEPAERERWHATSLPPPSPLAPYYASARSAGGYVFTCGEVPAGATDPDRSTSVAAQAREMYERLGSHLAAHGASPARVLQQTVFVRRARDAAPVAEAAREFYGAETPPPPTTLLGVADIGFHPGCDVEVELIAASDGRSADAR